MPTREETLFATTRTRAVQDALTALLDKPPQKTRAEVIRGFELRRTSGGILVAHLHYSAHPERNPETHPEWKASERKKYTSQASWDREQEIIDEAGGGELVFADTLVTHWDKIVITDPKWHPEPDWRVEAGFDHGKTNPTCLERVYIDKEGNIYFCGEYYQPGWEIWKHVPHILQMRDYHRIERIRSDPTIFANTNQQEARPGHTQEKAKSFAELYYDQGVEKLEPFTGDRSDISFAERLLLHWSNLDHRTPTVRIVCRNYADIPQPGMHPWDCPNLLWELMRTRRVKLTAQQLLSRNVSEAIVDKDNHARDACLIAGTRITTRRGGVPIEQITLADEVLTREGWRRVRRAWMTDENAEIWHAEFSDGVELFGTGNHPVLEASRGFLRIDALRYGMMCLCQNKKLSTGRRKWFDGWGSTSTVIRRAKSAIFDAIFATVASTFIRWFGFSSTGSPCPTAITSTIETATASTMNHGMSKPSKDLPIFECPPGAAGPRRTLHVSPKCGSTRLSGIAAQKGEHGIASTGENNFIRSLTKSVANALSRFGTRIVGKGTLSAVECVEQDGATPIAWITKSGDANTANANSNAIALLRQDFVHEYAQVLSVEKTPLRLPVYNIEVEGEPEYFANGILVHNCKYLVMSYPEPTARSLEERIAERLRPLVVGDAAKGIEPNPTKAAVQFRKIVEEAQDEGEPWRYGGRNGRRVLREIERKRGGRRR